MNNSNLKPQLKPQTPTRILVTGEGGQGVQIMAKILSRAAYLCGYEVCYLPHYGVEMRMGISLAYLQISQSSISYPKFEKADILAIMAKRNLEIPRSFIDIHTTVVNCINLPEFLRENNLPTRSLNMLCLGFFIKELKERNIRIVEQSWRQAVYHYLGHKEGLDTNLQAIKLALGSDRKCYTESLEKITPDIFPAIVKENNKKIHSIFPQFCKGCGLCLEKCPVQALSWSQDQLNFISRPLPEVDLDKCLACGFCQEICPDSAIGVVRK